MHSFITAEKEALICVRKGYRVQPGESVLVLADGNHELEVRPLLQRQTLSERTSR